MNFIKLYVVFRIPLAFLLSLFIGKINFIETLKSKIKNVVIKIEKNFSCFSLFIMLLLMAFVVPLLFFSAIFFVSRYFYLPYVAYLGLFLDVFFGSLCISIKNNPSPKEKNLGDTIENISKSMCLNSVAPIVFFAIGGSPLAFFYSAIKSISKNLKLKKLINYLSIKLSIWISFFCVFLLFPIFKPFEMVKIYFRDKYKRGKVEGNIVALFAGCLGIVLGGDFTEEDELAYRPLVGDKLKETDEKDVQKSKTLAFAVSIFTVALGLVLRAVVELHT